MKQVRKYHVELVREESKMLESIAGFNSSSAASAGIKEVLDLQKWHNERFGMLCLDAQNNLIGLHIISEGTLGECGVYVREVAMRALLNNAVSVILFHNHPGNSLKPSNSDIQATKTVKAGLETLQIKLLDHIILTDTSYTSLAEKGLI